MVGDAQSLYIFLTGVAQTAMEELMTELKYTKVLDKRTGKLYDPYVEFDKLMREPWVIEIFKRLKDR